MTQISQKSKALVDWDSAKVFAKLLSNENCLWTIFPPKKEGGRCYHFPTETNFERKVEECLKNNPKHSLRFKPCRFCKNLGRIQFTYKRSKSNFC